MSLNMLMPDGILCCLKNLKADEGEAESIVLSFFAIWWCFNRQWVRACWVGQKDLFRASWNHIYFCPGFKPKQWEWHILACFINWIFFMNHKNFGLLLPSITFKVSSHVDSHFHKYICFKYCTLWNHFQRFFTWIL